AAACYAPESRVYATAIGGILIPTKDGGRVPLQQLAEITVSNGASIIARRENQRQITIRTNIRGRDQGGFVNEAQRPFSQEIKIPARHHLSSPGMFPNLRPA